jgi:PAS domain S-box-containing protein
MDVTERKQAQQLFELAAEASPSGIVLANADGQIIQANAHIEELFGYRRNELVGQPLESLIPERFAAQDPFHPKQFLAHAETRPLKAAGDLFALRKDGTEFPVEIGLSRIETPQGLLVLVSIVDLSARKLAEEEAQRRRDEIGLLSRLSLLGEMTASIAHEVNQPLSGIISNASAGQRFIDRGDLDPERLRAILVDVVADGRRAHDIIRNIRNTVKKGGAIREPLDLNEIVREVAHLMEPEADSHSCKVETSLVSDLPKVEGDPIQIQQVLVNLIGNAFDVMSEIPPARRKVEITAQANGNESICVSVRDHGTGIRKETQSQLFQQFFTTKEEGLGMGLAIVRSIVEAHRGTIEAENAVGGGARFYFTLPIRKESNS